MDLTSVISQMGILLALIALGYLAAKCGVFPEGTNKVLAQLVIVITNPATVLHSALASERALSNGEVLLLTAIALGGFALLIGLGQALPRLLRVPENDRGVYIFMLTFTNMGFMGFPVIRALYGEGAIFYASIFNLVFQFVVYTYGASLLANQRPVRRGQQVSNVGSNNGRPMTAPTGAAEGSGTGDPSPTGVTRTGGTSRAPSPTGGEGTKPVTWRVLFSPIILASLLGYVCYLTGFRAPEIVTQGLGMLGGVTSPVCMLVIGIALSRVPFKAVFTNWRLYLLYGLRMVVLPVGVYFLVRLFVDNPLMLGITVVLLGMPAATMSTILAAKYNKNQELAASGVFLSTLFSFVTIPLLMWVLFA